MGAVVIVRIRAGAVGFANEGCVKIYIAGRSAPGICRIIGVNNDLDLIAGSDGQFCSIHNRITVRPLGITVNIGSQVVDNVCPTHGVPVSIFCTDAEGQGTGRRCSPVQVIALTACLNACIVCHVGVQFSRIHLRTLGVHKVHVELAVTGDGKNHGHSGVRRGNKHGHLAPPILGHLAVVSNGEALRTGNKQLSAAEIAGIPLCALVCNHIFQIVQVNGVVLGHTGLLHEVTGDLKGHVLFNSAKDIDQNFFTGQHVHRNSKAVNIVVVAGCIVFALRQCHFDFLLGVLVQAQFAIGSGSPCVAGKITVIGIQRNCDLLNAVNGNAFVSCIYAGDHGDDHNDGNQQRNCTFHSFFLLCKFIKTQDGTPCRKQKAG